MSSEEQKGEREVEVARDFIRLTHLPIDTNSLVKCIPPYPDLKATLENGSVIFLELAELCDSNLASSFARPKPDSNGVQYIRTSDPTETILANKLIKCYPVDAPIYLLCYTDGRIGTPMNVTLPTMQRKASVSLGPYSKIWLMYRNKVALVHSAVA